MHAKHALAIAVILITSQTWALTAYEKNHGCSGDTGDCAFGGGNSGGGGGGADYGPSGWMGSFSDGKGGTVDFYTDAGGEWWVENHADGTSQVGWDESAGPQMLKKFPKQPGAKRPKYGKAEMTPAAKKTLADAQQKAAAAKAAADKAAAEAAAAAAKKAAAVYTGPAISSRPAGVGVVSSSRAKP
jgi:hypothetical protein